MKTRTLGPSGPEVSEIGLGCMGMSAFYGSTDEAQARATIARALELGAERGITPGQLAIAWVLSRGEHVVPIPGTKRVAYLEENLAAAEVELSEAEAEAIAQALPPAAGERYPEAVMRSVNL